MLQCRMNHPRTEATEAKEWDELKLLWWIRPLPRQGDHRPKYLMETPSFHICWCHYCGMLRSITAGKTNPLIGSVVLLRLL